MSPRINRNTITAIVCGVIAAGVSQQASANLVQNGDFTAGSGTIPGQLGFNATVTDWSVPTPPSSYTFVFTPGSAATTGAPGQYGTLSLWGPGNGSANGMPATDPAGGNFLGADPAYQNGPITQTITGLTPGHTYALSFYWAGAQQSGYNGATTEGWDVSLGAESDSTGTVAVANHGFSGWSEVTFDYTATSASEVLSFLAIGGPASTEPPFALLGGVSLNATAPDATSTVTLLGLALSAMGFAARRRQ
jgi:hypothetical protein